VCCSAQQPCIQLHIVGFWVLLCGPELHQL
jgi:hypothetical protein